MRNLQEILYKVAISEVIGSTDTTVDGLTFDSRTVKDSFLYLAQKGTKVDGHDFIDKAIEAGASVIVAETFPAKTINGITYIKVADSQEALSTIAANFYGNPSSKLILVGVTGTNGKTTTVSLLHDLFQKLGYKAGMFTTVVNKIGDEEIKATHTTPDSIQLNSIMAEMVEKGCSHCFMEVSSHAVVQKRVHGLHFRLGVFTNITHDHLDYHKTFKEYIAAKRGFFNLLKADAYALANKDDKNATIMLQETKAQKKYFALRSGADYKCKIIESSFLGLALKIDGNEIWSQLIGRFNAYNLLAVYSAAVILGEDKMKTLVALSSLQPVSGRFQYINQDNISGIVDYAHTPDALENVLSTIKEIRTGAEQLITVVGCGGDRDKTKRPIMAEIACIFSDKVILTSDNPRTEDPEQIIEDMKKGVDPLSRKKVLAITNRKEAIRTACSMAQKDDIILVAGKGHETYQEINGVKHDFDDLKVLQESLNELNN